MTTPQTRPQMHGAAVSALGRQPGRHYRPEDYGPRCAVCLLPTIAAANPLGVRRPIHPSCDPELQMSLNAAGVAACRAQLAPTQRDHV